MAKSYVIPAYSQAFTVNGTAIGYAAVADASGFVVDATVWLSSATQTSVECIITDIIGNLVGLRIKPAMGQGPLYGRSNISAFLVADGAKISQTEQEYFAEHDTTSLQGPFVWRVDSAPIIKKLNGQDLWKGNLVSAGPGTPVDNATTAIPFTLLGTETLTLQSTVAFYLEVIAVGSYSALGAKSVLVETNEKYTFILNGGVKITVESVAGAATVKVFTKS